MWDVKMEKVLPALKTEGMFYLNYVGCKVFLEVVEDLTDLGFI